MAFKKCAADSSGFRGLVTFLSKGFLAVDNVHCIFWAEIRFFALLFFAEISILFSFV